MHATLSGKTAILSLERVSNCTNAMYSDKVSNYFLYGTILAFVMSHEGFVHTHNFNLPSGSLLGRTFIVFLV